MLSFIQLSNLCWASMCDIKSHCVLHFFDHQWCQAFLIYLLFSCKILSSVCNLINCNTSRFPAFNISQSLLKLMLIELVMPFNHFIFCCPLLPCPVFLSIRIFFNVPTGYLYIFFGKVFVQVFCPFLKNWVLFFFFDILYELCIYS